jgi:tetratricopeptide (TPR) repeat protein
MKTNITPQLETDIQTALALYGSTDKYEFDQELQRILAEMVRTPGGAINAGAILQLAATATGSDNRLIRDPSVTGNLATDFLTGDVWWWDRHYDNAETKYQHALQDVAATPFPDEEARDMKLAEIYDRLAELAFATSQFGKVITYTDAAIAYGGYASGGYQYYECLAYFKMGLYRAGVEACTTLIDHGGDYGEHFWRGKLNKALGNSDAALDDFTVAARSGPQWGTSAAIEMSLIYGERADYKGQLHVLDAYPYLWDESSQRRDDLAVVYNNRCYAYMKLGELRRALDDCTASLRFGSLPEAFAKQQELVKLMKDNAAQDPDKPI